MSDERHGLRAALVLAVLGGGACVAGPSGEQREVAPDSSSTESARMLACGQGSARAVALLEPSDALRDQAAGELVCGLALERADDGQLVVRELLREGEGEGEDREPARLGLGPAPEACGAELELCELWGLRDVLGPVVFAQVRGHESEIPVQVYVGWIDGERLTFAETWHGRPSTVDHTRVGPPWALGPFDCEGELALLPVARLPEAGAESPSPTLLALAGRWTVDEAGVAQGPEASSTGTAKVDPASCRALVRALP
ncbi:hypothetical protein ENSA5_21620 [Enhygromyxa salina]|uniref:Lipoprotein n=1 Tax=Enhygromyxa salina TaxID=215803 RepID=A0A2S9YBM0_9BACT|nr:hypothetical protein [Enhygromyxa salina]PRQ02517.1 hypothetical protein ENSA5_21620 [Enhygromyxa salina]